VSEVVIVGHRGTSCAHAMGPQGSSELATGADEDVPSTACATRSSRWRRTTAAMGRYCVGSRMHRRAARSTGTRAGSGVGSVRSSASSSSHHPLLLLAARLAKREAVRSWLLHLDR
jgi:hypothetical protein